MTCLACILGLANTAASTTTTHASSVPVTPAIVASAITRQPQVALTFDDGPSPYTAEILNVLRQFHAHATFFIVGEHAALYASTLRASLRDGNELANHTFTHANLLGLSNGGVAGELESTQAAIHASTEFTPRWFRPPYGAVDARVSGVAASIGLRTAIWSVDPRDWSRPGSEAIAANVIANLRPGAIVIMHDGGGDRSETVAALPAILEAMRARGLHAVTMSELFALQSPPLPPAPTCEPDGPVRHFSADGIPAYPKHAIFRAWSERVCAGFNLGPATSREYILSPGLMAQDFARTGHRIVFDTTTRRLHVQVVWGWIIKAFESRGVQPRWGWAITRAWFEAFLHFHDWGAALDPPSIHNGLTMQRFEHGVAMARVGNVEWKRS